MNSKTFPEPMEGIEPTTPRLQITCSGQLSYIGKMLPLIKGLQIYNFFIYISTFADQVVLIPCDESHCHTKIDF